MGIMEKKMKKTIGILGSIKGFKGYILGLYGDNGKENESYYSILRSYRDNGTENGNNHNRVI